MASVRLKNVEKKFEGGVVAVKDFTLDIEDKEFVILVGPSGCGKTTTLRMVAGLEDATNGEIYIGEKFVNDDQPKDRDIAMVFQNYALYPHMTVYDNMAFGLKLRKTPKEDIKRRVTEAARILEIEHLLDRKPKALSGGQRQRVALGRAIVRNPKVFLMDEPLSNLDAKLRAQMRIEISKLHQKLNTTIIYVTHDQTEALTMGTKIVVMKDGLIQQVDSPQVLYENPCNMFVAGFIGTPQINFINVRLEKRGDDAYVTFGRNSLKLPAASSKALLKTDYIGKDIVMGIRPECIHDEEMYTKAATDNLLEARVEVIEMLGSETLLYVYVDDTPLTARVDPRSHSKANDVIKIALDMHRIHLFDKETEQVISI